MFTTSHGIDVSQMQFLEICAVFYLCIYQLGYFRLFKILGYKGEIFAFVLYLPIDAWRKYKVITKNCCHSV